MADQHESGRGGQPDGKAEITYGNSKPISFEEAFAEKPRVPDAVLDVFNDLIREHINAGGFSSFSRKAVVEGLQQHGVDLDEANENNWLDVKTINEIYKEKGWEVSDPTPLDERFQTKYLFVNIKR